MASPSSATLAALLQASASANGGVGGGASGAGGVYRPLARNASSSALLVDLPLHFKGSGGGTLSRSNSFSLFRGGLLSGGGGGAGGASTLLGSPGSGFGGVPRSPSILSLLSGNPTVALRESHSAERLLGLVPKAAPLGRQGSSSNLVAGGGWSVGAAGAAGGGAGGATGVGGGVSSAHPPAHHLYQHGGLLTGGLTPSAAHPPAFLTGNGGSSNHMVAHLTGPAAAAAAVAAVTPPLGVFNLMGGGLGERALSFSQLPGLGVELDLDETVAVASALQDGKWGP